MDIIIDNTSITNTPKPKRRRTREDWLALVKTWEDSKQTQQAFCQDRSLCYRQFNQWKNRFKQENNTVAQFVPVQLKTPTRVASPSGVQVVLPNGIRIEIASEHHVPLLVDSVKALAALSC